jgi:hypothetical protein
MRSSVSPKSQLTILIVVKRGFDHFTDKKVWSTIIGMLKKTGSSVFLLSHNFFPLLPSQSQPPLILLISFPSLYSPLSHKLYLFILKFDMMK